MNDKVESENWISVKKTVWVIMLAVSFFVFFPAFIALLIIWLIGKVRLLD
jgi:hypothetical protein